MTGRKLIGAVLVAGALVLAPASSTYSQASGPSGIQNGAAITGDAEDIRLVQMALKNRGYDPGEINGTLNSETIAAVRKFQEANQLRISGKLDPPTLNALGVSPRQAAPGQSTVLGLSGDDLFRVETALRARGFDPGTGDSTDGALREALRKFQAQNDLEVTGTLNAATIRALGVDIALEDTNQYLERKGAESADRPQTGSNYEPVAPDRSRSRADEPKPEKVNPEIRNRVAKSAALLTEVTKNRDKRIPAELLQRSEAIAIWPNMTKGAMSSGSQYGRGVISKRLPGGGWSAPAFTFLSGASFEKQLGDNSTDLILVFTDANVLGSFEKGMTLRLGTDARVVAGPVGRPGNAEAARDSTPGIYAYARSNSVLQGVLVEGAMMNMDADANGKAYGANVEPRVILNSDSMKTNDAIRNFVDVLNRVASRKISQQLP